MRIGLYSTQVFPSKPDLDGYGGLENIVGLLSKYYDEHGHEVHLFATKDSYQPKHGFIYAPQVPSDEVAAWKTFIDNPQSKKTLMDVDIIHDHSWGYAPYMIYNERNGKLIKTHHGPDAGFRDKPPFKSNLVGVSHNHAKNLSASSGCVWRGVQNGIDLANYPIKREKQDYLLWVSRIFPPKGCHRFIDICDKLQMKGYVLGGSFGQDPDYINFIKKKLENSKYVSVVGMLGEAVPFAKKLEMYQNAKAVVMPIEESFTVPGTNKVYNFIEPFGLIAPEANACFPAGTLVNTPTGMKAIEGLTRGDKVLDSFGFPTRVLNPTARNYDGKMYTLKARGLQLITATENHPFLCRQEGYPRWMMVGDLREGDFILTPKLPWLNESFEIDGHSKRKDSKINKIQLSDDFAELLGWYCADGYPSGEDAISFSLGINDEHIKRVEQLIQNLGLKTWKSKEGNCIIVYSGSPILRRVMLELCGKGAYHKHIPDIILYGDLNHVNSFLYGYCCGDGHKDKNTSIVYATVSENLSRQTALLATRLGLLSSVITHTRNNTEIEIRGRKANQRKTIYRVRVHGVDLDNDKHKLKATGYRSNGQRFFDEFGLWSQIESMGESNYNGTVHNIHTIRGTYLAENMAVHNCGTPMIVTPSGGWNETTLHGYSGFFANSDDDFCYCIKHIDEIKPDNCRKHAEHFSYERMAQEYLKLYQFIIDGGRW